ncbi:MAG: phage portal protein [Vicinamibacteria bacterium]
MGVFFKPREERRALTKVPWNVGASLNAPMSQSKALSLAPVFAANRHITDFGSTLPLKSYRKLADQRIPMDTLPPLFRSLEERAQLVSWLAQAFSSLVLRGNAVGLVTAVDGFGFPTDIVWLHMDRISVDMSTGVDRWFVDGRRADLFHRGGNLVHIPWIVLPGQVLGLSPIGYFANTIGASLAAQQYGGDWFAGGGFPPSVFKHTETTVPSKVADDIRDRLKRALRRREPLVHGNDWEFTPVSVPPGEAQFIESQKLSATQVATIYGIDPTEVGGEPPGSLTYSNEEQRDIHRARDMRPYLTRFERAFSSWAPSPQNIKFNVDAIVRADLKTRFEVYKIQDDMGFESIDAMRAREDLPPLPNGAGANAVPARDTQPTPETDR